MTSLVNNREFLGGGPWLGRRPAGPLAGQAGCHSRQATGLFSGATDRRNGFAEGARFCHELSD